MAQLTELIGQQTVAIEQLRDTMTGINSVMESQLESLKSIARWQDQTALYTSHLQNIKIDLNQIRKWSEPISQIAQRIEDIHLDNTAERQEDLSGGGDDDALNISTTLLQQIANNTERTAIAVEQIASVQAEPFEDKRTETSKPISRREQKSKGEQGEIGKAVGTAGTFLKDVFKGFLALGALFATVLTSPSSFFVTLREFFSSVKGLFSQLLGFFLNDVAPVISSLFESLLGFFNRLAPELSELGSAIGDALRRVGPDVMETLRPVLQFLADGIIKSVDMMTTGVARLPEVVDTFFNFVSKVSEKLFNSAGEYENNIDAIKGFFEMLGTKFNEYTQGDFLAAFEDAMFGMFNIIIDVANGIIRRAVDVHNSLAGEDNQLDPQDFLISDERRFMTHTEDLTTDMADRVMRYLHQNNLPLTRDNFLKAVEEMTSHDTLQVLHDRNDMRIRGLRQPGTFVIDEETGETVPEELDVGGMVATREAFFDMELAEFEQLVKDQGRRLSRRMRFEDDAPSVMGADAEKFMEISGIHNAYPFEAARDMIPDTIIVADKPNKNGMYTHYYDPETGEEKPFKEDSWLRVALADAGQFLRQRNSTGSSITPAPPPPGNVNKTPNTFGGGTGFNLSRASVNNQFVPDPSVHTPIVVAPAISGGSSSTTVNSSQVSLHSGTLSRNPFYRK